MALTKITSRTIEPGSISSNSLSQDVVETISSAAGGVSPVIANVQIANSTYGVLDDTAVALEGGYIILNGNNFGSNCQLVIGDTLASSITTVSNTVIRAQVPAKTAGSYILYLTNQDTGSVAIRVNGLTYSGTPTWVTGSTLTTVLVDDAISVQLDASGATSYQLQAGSTLPTGLSLAANGLLSGTVAGIGEETTYNFIIEAIDAENQESPRTFSITITLGDEYIYATTLLLNGDGANGANNNTFVDSSDNNFAITRNGNATQGSFSPFSAPDGKWSNYFNGSNSSITFPGNVEPAKPALNILNGSYTIECWFNANSLAGSHTIVSKFSDLFAPGVGYYVGVTSSSIFVSTGEVSTSRSYSFSTGIWYHLAVSVLNNVGTVYVNGVAVGDTFNAGVDNATNHPFAIGYRNGNFAGLYFNGNISNIRILKGTALYTSNFTPPTEPLTAIANTVLLTCQSNRFKDNSTNNLTLTPNGNVSVTSFAPFAPTTTYSAATNGGSAYFDGSGDYLTAPTGSAFQFDGNFTIEAWVNSSTGVGQTNWSGIFDTRATNISSTTGISVNLNPSGYLNFYINGTNNLSTIILGANNWTHVAVVRNGSTITLYQNGVSVASTSYATSLTSGYCWIGSLAGPDSLGYWQGYISNLRIIKGTAVYTSNFTPPTQPLTAISNTSLLCNFTNAGILDYTGKNNLETVGNAQISTAEKKFGTGSIILSPGGGSHYTRVPLTDSLKFGTGDFTIECWIYLITNAAGICTVFSNYNSFAAGSLSLFAGHSGASANHFIIAHNGVFPSLSSTTTLNSRLGLWTHLAVVRSSGQIKLYVNGVSEGTPIASTVALDGVGSYFWVGSTGDSTASTPNCYIDDFRITKGIARYTSNFTPPTSAHKLR